MRISPTAPRSRESSPATIRSAASGTNMKRAHPRYRRTWNPRNSPFESDQDTSTDSTRAWGWDVLFHSIQDSIMDRSPSKTASTPPSHRFWTYPSSPSDSAFSAQYARKLTPCTRPRKTTTARAFTTKRIETMSKNFIVAIADSTLNAAEGHSRQLGRRQSSATIRRTRTHIDRMESRPNCADTNRAWTAVELRATRAGTLGPGPVRARLGDRWWGALRRTLCGISWTGHRVGAVGRERADREASAVPAGGRSGARPQPASPIPQRSVRPRPRSARRT